MAFVIGINADFRSVAKTLNDIQKKQLPYAAALALTGLAKRVQEAEKEALPKIFDRPTPFTMSSIAVRGATKNKLAATVFVKDIAAAYLLPYEVGGSHTLIGSGKTWLNPKDRALLNQYGNLSKGVLQRLEGRPDMFVGSIKTKSGQTIGGIWQRPANTKVVATRGKRGVATRGANKTGHLKLIIRFGDAMPVKQHLDFAVRAQQVVAANFGAEFGKAMAKAMATARR